MLTPTELNDVRLHLERALQWLGKGDVVLERMLVEADNILLAAQERYFNKDNLS